MLLMGVIIVLYHNPLADPTDELIKKVIACVLIVAAVSYTHLDVYKRQDLAGPVCCGAYIQR